MTTSGTRGRDALVVAASVLLLLLTIAAVARERLREPPSVRALPAQRHVAESVGDPLAGTAAAPVAPSAGQTTYTVSAGDSLSIVAERFGMSTDALMAANGLTDPDAIFVGQELVLAVVPTRDGPGVRTVPDSELVYGPAYADFDVAGFLAGQWGPLATYQEIVEEEVLTGPAIVQRVADEFSVGPRVLLAFVEARSGWVTGSAVADNPSPTDFPAGMADPLRAGLWRQMNWLADRLNGGYYDWKTRDSRLLTTADGMHLGGHPDLGPGSFAVQRALALQSTEAELLPRLVAFDAAYRRLFGDPWEREMSPRAATFPSLGLPFAEGDTWWLTGGPHGGWADGSAWAAIDLVPDGEERGCFVSPAWATAVGDGVLVGAGEGQLWLDLDGDGDRHTGPAVLYLHLAAEDRAAPGTRVKRGDPLGHPSCEGGVSSATHLHLARTFDGEWLAAAGAVPLEMAGWSTYGAPEPYDGGFAGADGERREACECRKDGYNDVDG